MAKIHDVEQGSVPWYNLRIGIPTASKFEKIIQPSTGKISRSKDGKQLAEKVRTFAYLLIAEKLLNAPIESLRGIEVMELGKEREPMAAKVYSVENEVELKTVGFITTNDGRVGASPDRLIVGVNGGVEIKCPSAQVHVGYLAEGFGDDYIPQVQGQNYVGEFEFSDRFSFYPGWPTKMQRTYRDEEYIRNLDAALREFNDFKDEAYEKIKKQGFFIEPNSITMPVDVELGDDETASRMLRGI